MASYLLSGLSGYVHIGLVLLWISILLYPFHPASSQGPLLLFWDWLHFSQQSTFVSRRQNASPSWAAWRLRGRMVFVLVYYCLYRWTWYLQVFGNCSQGWTRLVKVYNVFSELLADFFWFSHRYTPNWLKWCQLAYQKLLKPWHHFLEFSKLFKKAQST